MSRDNEVAAPSLPDPVNLLEVPSEDGISVRILAHMKGYDPVGPESGPNLFDVGADREGTASQGCPGKGATGPD